MVLELKVPPGHELADLINMTGVGLLTYLLSFIYIGIYWNNHHHMFQLVRHVSGAILWANLGLLFMLSLVPFTTAWMDDPRFARLPVVVYGINLLGAAVSYYILQLAVFRRDGPDGLLHQALGRPLKGKLRPAASVLGILGSFAAPWLGVLAYVTVAVAWLVPDRRA